MNGQPRSCWDPTQYLTDIDIRNIHARLEELAPASHGRLVFWNGMPRECAQRWANDHGMLTLSSAMGPLMDIAHSSCPKPQKTKKQWRRYVKGASGLFAEYACKGGAVTILMRPPEQQSTPRRDSTFWEIERPILVGEKAIQSGTKLVTIYPTEVLKGSKSQRDSNIGSSISTQNSSHVVSRASNKATKEVSMSAAKKANKIANKAQVNNAKEMNEMEKEKKKMRKEKKKAKKEKKKAKKEKETAKKEKKKAKREKRKAKREKRKAKTGSAKDRQGCSLDRTQLSQVYRESTPLGELLRSRRCHVSSYLKLIV